MTIVAGDPSHSDQVNHLRVETVNLTDPDGQDLFDSFSATVTVSDGRLTLAPGSGALNAKVCYIEIASQ